MASTRPVSWGKLCALACAFAALAVSAQAAEAPWYKRALNRVTGKSSAPQSADIPDPSKVLTSGAPKPAPVYKEEPAIPEAEEAAGAEEALEDYPDEEVAPDEVDFSQERTPADDAARREFPMPQPRTPEAPRVPPSPDQYRTPAPDPVRAAERDRR